MDIVVADGVSEVKSIFKDRSDNKGDIVAPVFARSCPSQVTGDIEVTCQGKIIVVKKPSEAGVVGELFNLIPVEATRNAARPRVGLFCSSGVDNVDLVALDAHIQELQTENQDLSANRAGN